MKTIKVIGEKGTRCRWYFGYAFISVSKVEIVVEVRRWSYWCAKFGVMKAGKLLKKGKIRRVGGVYTDLEKSYNIKRLKKELLFEERERKINNKIREGP